MSGEDRSGLLTRIRQRIRAASAADDGLDRLSWLRMRLRRAADEGLDPIERATALDVVAAAELVEIEDELLAEMLKFLSSGDELLQVTAVASGTFLSARSKAKLRAAVEDAARDGTRRLQRAASAFLRELA